MSDLSKRRLRGLAVALIAGVSFVGGVAASSLSSEPIPVRVPCGDMLETAAEDDGCVIVPLWAVEAGL